jgi:hypothetical protein
MSDTHTLPIHADIGDWGDSEWDAFTVWLKGALNTSIVDVTFIKKDGTERLMKCTLNPDVLPKVEIKEGAKPRKESTTSMRVFDTEKNEWRSFTIRSVRNVRFIL